MKFFIPRFLIVFIVFLSPLSAKVLKLESEQKDCIEIQAEKNAKIRNESEVVEENPEKKKEEPSGESEKMLEIGNLAFPPSQQPSPLISLGQNIIDRKKPLAQAVVSQLKGEDRYSIYINPAILYPFTDDFSLFVVVPIGVRSRERKHRSSGTGDLTLQIEYAYYTKEYRTYYDQASIVGNVTLPTGSIKKSPSTGLGANSFFIGGTYSRMGMDWFGFISSGAIFMASSHRTQFGNQYLYQLGFGRRIFSTNEWLFDWMIEFDGTYCWKDKMHGKINSNSGGNVVYLTPSLWLSSKESLFIQFGLGCPILQYLCGHQKKDKYLLLFTSGWLF